MWVNFMRDKLWVMTEPQRQNLLRKVDPLSTIWNNKFITQREKLEIVIAKVRVFVWNISSPPLSDIKDMGFRMFL